MTSIAQAFEMARKSFEAGDWPQAERLCRQVVQAAPGHSGGWYLLGLIAARTDRNDLAIDCFRAAIRLEPDLADAHNSLGVALARQRKTAEAVACFRQAVCINPDHASAYYNLGQALRQRGEPDAAAACFREALRIRPDDAAAHYGLGNALREQGRLEDAVASYRQAVRGWPDHPELRNNLGTALQELGPLEEAEAQLRQALRLRPAYARAAYNLGLVLWTQGRPEEAAESYGQAVRLEPGYARAHLNLGNALKDQGRLDESIAAYRAAIELEPDNAGYHDNLILAMHYHPDFDQRAIGEECRRWSERHAEALSRDIPPHTNRPEPERRLRIGYVSTEFRNHVEGWLVAPLLCHHDHGPFEIYCYSRVARPDAYTERLRGQADVWRDTVGLSDQQTADLVRDDRIDILVDLKVHTANNQLLVFARKPAPVQVTWLGYPGTTGLKTVDYRLTDPYIDPPGLFDAFYSEESLRLPDTIWCYEPPADSPPVGALPAAEAGAITFGCLNSFCKVNDGCLALWAGVLRAVPRSRLLLRAPRGLARDHTLTVLVQEGIAAARVEFVDLLPRSEYLRLYHRVDLALDPLPYNGHVTGFDGFWMGVPTLTLVGRTVVGRVGWSQLCNLDLKELAAETPEQFVAIATEVAGDLARLQELRGTLRQRILRSPLMGAPRFARHIEEAYRRMWRRWCEGRRRGPADRDHPSDMR
jgi:predicted O-linked N-acetylglucosamine transferase (SPINDLY family)